MNVLKSYNEHELLLRVAEGDESAFSDFFYYMIIRLRPAISKYVRDEEEMDDIIQDTFIKLWLNRDVLVDIVNIHGYVFKVALNTLRMRIRNEMAHRRQQAQWEQMHNDPLFSHTGEQGIAEMREVIRLAVGALSGQRRKIYQLSREQGMTIPEIAKALDLSPNTVKNTLITALSSIRERLILAGYSFTLACIWLSL